MLSGFLMRVFREDEAVAIFSNKESGADREQELLHLLDHPLVRTML